MSPKSIHRYGKLKIINLLNKEKEREFLTVCQEKLSRAFEENIA